MELVIGRFGRFLTQSNHFKQQARCVTERAFLPVLDHTISALATSVYRTEGLGDDEIWALGEAEVCAPSGKPCYGVGEVSPGEIARVGLDVASDDAPSRHANIIGWPGDKNARKSRAQQLAALATLKLRS